MKKTFLVIPLESLSSHEANSMFHLPIMVMFLFLSNRTYAQLDKYTLISNATDYVPFERNINVTNLNSCAIICSQSSNPCHAVAFDPNGYGCQLLKDSALDYGLGVTVHGDVYANWVTGILHTDL